MFPGPVNGGYHSVRKITIRRFAVCVLVFCLAISAGAAEREIPDVLRVTQTIETVKKKNYQMITYTVLHSVREDVNDAINARVAALKEEAEPLVPRGNESSTGTARADICTQITRTGNRWMSFHIVAQVSAEDNQYWVKSEDYTYEMESGRLIRLGDIIREDAWDTLLREIRTQVVNLFPGDAPDEGALDALCRREDLADAGFVATPGHLALYFPAADIYPAHAEALLRVEIYVPELWELLTEEARQETDCTGYDMIAMTYDDGPSKGTTRRMLNAAACHPGQVTFFVIGNRLVQNAELLHREFDAGHSIQSHSWQHYIGDIKPQKEAEWEAQFNQDMGSIIGVTPVMMRPPGGHENNYLLAGCELPMILWSVNSCDASSDEYVDDVPRLYSCVVGTGDGDILLFHDIKRNAGELADKCMGSFEERNLLLVTLNDLCALRGVTLEPGLILKNVPRDGIGNE